MLTHLTDFFKSINWVDVALALIFVRVIFISVKNGFVTEFCKFLGIVFALFVSLHYYAGSAAWLAERTTLPLVSWRFLTFLFLWVLVVLLFKFIGDGLLILFKVQTNNQGLDRYAAGFLGAGRAIFVCSLTIFAFLLMPHNGMRAYALKSWGYKIAGQAAPNTYKFFYQTLVGKLFASEKFNADVFAVIGNKHGVNPR